MILPYNLAWPAYRSAIRHTLTYSSIFKMPHHYADKIDGREYGLIPCNDHEHAIRCFCGGMHNSCAASTMRRFCGTKVLLW